MNGRKAVPWYVQFVNNVAICYVADSLSKRLKMGDELRIYNSHRYHSEREQWYSRIYTAAYREIERELLNSKRFTLCEVCCRARLIVEDPHEHTVKPSGIDVTTSELPQP